MLEVVYIFFLLNELIVSFYMFIRKFEFYLINFIF
jgi:hypothetical protein